MQFRTVYGCTIENALDSPVLLKVTFVVVVVPADRPLRSIVPAFNAVSGAAVE